MDKTTSFWGRTDRSGDCWVWTGAIWGNNDYGCVRHEGKQWSAHRLAWTLTSGQIPDGMKVLHKCDVPRCIRPDHLFLGTQADNVQDAARKGRQSNQYRGVTHCKREHEFSPENTRHDGRGRQCRTCDDIRRENARLRRLKVM